MEAAATIKLTCVGTGDAFGSGGRLNSCFHLRVGEQQLLLDCGCSSLIGLERCGINPDEIDTVIISHLHGDHFGGIPYLFLAAKYLSPRTRPLTLIGPVGLKKRVEALANALYPGLGGAHDFPLDYLVFTEGKRITLDQIQIRPFAVKHGGGKYAYGIRLETGGKIISYTGDTEWTEELLPLAQGSDLLIAECFSYTRAVAGHLNYQQLLEEQSRFNCQRLVLTHPGPEVLAQLNSLELDFASDGDIIEI